MPVRILLADDHELVRRGIRAVLGSRPEWQICGEATTGREAVTLALQLKPEVVIMDIGMPDLNGLEATRKILKDLPHAEVLILTMHDTEQLVRAVLDAGARGYLLKSDAGRDLIAAVDALHQHRPFFTTAVSEMVLQGYLIKTAASESPAPALRLTPREREILQLLAEGKTNKEVATVLHISVKTAETHRGRIMAKLNLRSVSDLVRYAIRNRIVEL